MTGQGADAKTEKGEKSTPKINSSSRWLPIKADAGGTQVSGECLCTHTHTNTNTTTLQLSNFPQQGTCAVMRVCSDPNSSTEQRNLAAAAPDYGLYSQDAVLVQMQNQGTLH